MLARGKLTVVVVAVLAGTPLWAQAPDKDAAGAQPAAVQAAPPSNEFSASSVRVGGIDISGLVDGYYTWNNNHPNSGFDQLYNFDDRGDQWDLNMAKLTLSRDPAPVGFRVDVGFGRAFEVIKTPHPDPEFFRFIEQSYISVKPKGWKGFEADFGEFVTSAGSEVIESKDNWNYSRSLLFSWAAPYYHFGMRTSMPLAGGVNVGFQLVNGWNAIVDQHGNNMKTAGFTAGITRNKFTWSNSYYIGPQFTDVNDLNRDVNKIRSLYDSAFLYTPNSKFNAYVNFDYGRQNLPSGSAHWVGVAGAARFQLNNRFAVSPRLEYFNDADGFSTGSRQHLHEVTVTGECKVVDGFLARLEYRHDGSNINFFDHGNDRAGVKGQTTVTLGLIAYFPIKH